MPALRLVTLLALAGPQPLVGQEIARDSNTARSDRLPAISYGDTSLVHPSWFSFPVIKNVVVVAFRDHTTDAQRDQALASVRGLLIDTTHFWVIRVPSHPDACGVLRATERLEDLPWVKFAMPYFLIPVGDGSGRRSKVTRPRSPEERSPDALPSCPAAEAVLR